MTQSHSFHIPVMGIGFTIDTPLKVSQFGIDSVMALADDMLLEKIRKKYCGIFDLTYKEITNKVEDFRAKRVTSYLNLMNTLSENKFEELKESLFEKGNDVKDYFLGMPFAKKLKNEFVHLVENGVDIKGMKDWLMNNLNQGSLDVNIMTKVDKENYDSEEKLPMEYNDAFAAVRGFAKSNLSSAVVLSAGMSPRLYSYFEKFNDFYHDGEGRVNKKIILKVSDYRSALIQGRFFAKKGIWISEYRVESGLNCGGHAFATTGHLLGPILEEFKQNKQELLDSVFETLCTAREAKELKPMQQPPALKITAQGGVGTAEEHQFLLNNYKVDSVGWGTPFLLVPEVVNLDNQTLDLLAKAEEADLYLSNISPLGVPFNNLRGNTQDVTKYEAIDKGRPGSACPKRYLALSKEYGDMALCPASRQYQRLKIKDLDEKPLSNEAYQSELNKITEKSCICVGLGTSALIVNDIDTKVEGTGVSVCPGPNMAYFSHIATLKDMTRHIYGSINLVTRTDRPNMFVKEMNLYLDYFKDQIQEMITPLNKKQEKYLTTFSNNMSEGIAYYQNLFKGLKSEFDDMKSNILSDFEEGRIVLEKLNTKINQLRPELVGV